jgi:hypothetical protein
MKTVKLNLYSFDELNESAQEKVIATWRDNDEYFWGSENSESLEAFCKIFAIKIKDYDYGYRNYINSRFNLDLDILEFKNTLAYKYLWNNYKSDIFKSKYYYKNGKKRLSNIQLNDDCVLTGYYIDNEILAPIYDFLKKPDNSSIENLLNDCLNNWLSACRKDYEYWLSAESIREDIACNDYLFLANGQLASSVYQEKEAA